MAPPPRPSASSSSFKENKLLPLSSSSSSSRGSGSLPPPPRTPHSPPSFLKSIRTKAAEAAAAAVSASSSSSRGSNGSSKGLPTSTSAPELQRRRERDRRRKLLAVASAVLLILLALGFLLSFRTLRAAERVETEEKKTAFGQRTAALVRGKAVRPASEAAAVASLRVRAFAAAAASRASASLSATAMALSSSSSSPSSETAPGGKAPSQEPPPQQQQQQSHQTRKQRFPLSTRPLSAFVGVQSRPVTPRRRALRDTWLPSTPEEREKLMTPFESSSPSASPASLSSPSSPAPPLLKHRGIAFRFVVGLSADPSENLLVEDEARQHDDILILGVRESYDNLVLKTVAFFSAAVEAFPGASFIVKLDNDVYVRPDNLAFVADQWQEAGRDYVGCLMKGGEVFDDKRSVYYEPLNALLPNKKYFGYMSGSAYALSRRAALLLRSRTTAAAGVEEFGASVASKNGKNGESSSSSSSSESSGILKGRLGGLRPMACEDCAVGLWLLAHDVKHGEDLRMCRYDREVEVDVEEEVVVAGSGEKVKTTTKRKKHSCAPAAAGSTAAGAPVVVTNRCNGLCDPMQSLVDLHGDPACRAPTIGVEGGGEGGPSSALPLGDFWSSNAVLSRADAANLECIKVTAEGDIDKSACKEEKKDGGR